MSASPTLNLGSFCSSAVNFPSNHSQKASLLHGTRPLILPASPNQLLRWSNGARSAGKSTPFKMSVAAVDSSKPSEKEQQEVARERYHFLVANAKFMLDEEEHFQEQLAERLRLFGERNIDQDFWLVIEPKFLVKFPAITKRLKRPAVALVSTNGTWITFMKLRLDRVLQDSYEADTLEEALASNPSNLEFENPGKWTAPYPKYEFGWWEPFLPPSSRTAQV